MTDEQLEEKLLGLATPILGRDRAVAVAEMCWGLLGLDDISTLI